MLKLRDYFNPLSLPDENTARRICERLCAQAPEQSRLKTIAAVGAYDAEIGGPRVDSRRLTGIMSYLLRSRLLIDPDFSIDVVNLAHRRNFLEEDKKYDLVFISFILREQLRGTFACATDHKINEPFSSYAHFRGHYGVALGPQHNETVWQKRVVASDPRLVVTYGGQAEIGTHVLCAGDQSTRLTPVIATPAFKIGHFPTKKWNRHGEPDLDSKASLELLYNHTANDLPMPWLGFAATPDYLQASAAGASPQTVLGRQVRALGL
ncbi:MAG: hypothetical protein NDJ24_07460 [Alphaproteobacteria bacterium]|nr:hypothetical protein [Alphaproteobacteria bacterium]